MSRTTNVALTPRIVAAARRLWHQRGEDGLTLRAVARAAGTTTATMYQRFPTKHHLIEAIAARTQNAMAASIMRSRDLGHACQIYLRYARRHRHDYTLFYGPSFPRFFAQGKPRPGFDWAMEQLARRHGGKPKDYEVTAYALQNLLHGAASMLVHVPKGALERAIRESCLLGCKALIARPLPPKKRRQQRTR